MIRKKERITRKIESFTEMINSEEFNEIYRPYGSEEKTRAIQIKSKTEFLGAYVTEADPGLNYGQPFKLYHHYRTPEGLILIKEVSAITGLSSQPFELVIIDEDTILFFGVYIAKDQEGRKIIKDSQITVS